MSRFKTVALSGLVALGMLAAVPGAAFAANPACGAVLMANRTLSGDLDCSGYAGDALTLGKKGITLNLNGHTITGPAGDDSYDGVYSSKKNTTVRNGTIENYGYGVYFYGVVGGTAKGLHVIGEAGDTDDEGIYFYYGTMNTIKNNTISGVKYGIDVEYAADNWIKNNTITVDNTGSGIYIYQDTGDHIVGNNISHDDYGVYDYESAHQTYENNTSNGGDAVGATGFYLYCNGAGWVHAINNTASHNGDYGFDTEDCYDYYSPYEGERTVMRGNKALDNGDDAYGFYDYYSINALWDGNVSKRSGEVGFYLDYPSYVVFKNNVANRNGGDGIYVDNNNSGYGNFKSFVNNTANNNGKYGIYAEWGISGASGNVSHDNATAPDNCWNVACN